MEISFLYRDCLIMLTRLWPHFKLFNSGLKEKAKAGQRTKSLCRLTLANSIDFIRMSCFIIKQNKDYSAQSNAPLCESVDQQKWRLIHMWAV